MIRKLVHSQDSYYKLNPTKSGETSINLSNELLSYIAPGLEKGEEADIVFRIYKEDFVKGVAYIASSFPLYSSTSRDSIKVDLDISFFSDIIQVIAQFFGDNDSKDYKIHVKYRQDDRIYLNNLNVDGFNIRHFFVEEKTILTFDKQDVCNLRISYIDDDFLIKEKVLKEFCKKVILFLYQQDSLSKLQPYFTSSIENYIQVRYGDFVLHRLLSPNVTVSKIGERWFSEIVNINNVDYVICAEWTRQLNNSSVPSYEALKLIIESLYDGMYKFDYEEGFYYLKESCSNKSSLNKADCSTSLSTLQQIYYGAPGTGKSHTINEVTKGENVIRTTFHPDSDYSSFVGAYKPTMELLPICDELGQPMTIGGTVLHKEQVVYEFVEQAFLQAYVNAWKNRQVGSLIIDNGNYALSGMNDDVVCWRNCNAKPESKEGNTAQKETIKKYYDGIAPEDTKTNAQKVIASYLKGLDSDFEKAWIKLKARLSTVIPQFLVIEEINRGNCAQIFGDIFQLLDRNDYGFSVYPINADKDMKKHLEKAFKDVSIDNADIINQQYKGRDVVKEVLNGDILLLPDNLYIWATMNTSDQSLFPIDSAFKRRWDWEYVPIEQPEEGAEGEPRKWKIRADGHWCYWWEFLQAINEEIEEVTHSEDKQLGYFFAKPQEGEYIDAKTFVSKVVFYLWNDVFKDENSEIFRYKKLEGKWDVDMPAPKRDNLYFRSFVKGREDVDEKMVRWFVNNLLKEHNVVLLDDGHQNPVTTDDNSKEENIACMRPYKEESPADADGTEDAIDGNNVNSPNGEDQPTDQVKNVVG